MYRISAVHKGSDLRTDSFVIYDDFFASNGEEAVVNSPKLKLEDNAAGSLEFTLPVTNGSYNTLQRLTDTIVVTKEDSVIFIGRPITEKKNFWNDKAITCEGALSFLNDTTQPKHEYGDIAVSQLLTALLAVHNNLVSSDRQIYLGVVEAQVDLTVNISTDNDKTLQYVNDILDKTEGHLRVRYDTLTGHIYLDYLYDYPSTSNQVIDFGSNLQDFTQSWDATEFVTAIRPIGASLEESQFADLDENVTVETADADEYHQAGSPYVVNTTAQAAYGWIEATVSWDDIDDPDTLLLKAEEYLTDIQFDTIELTVSAVDLHYLNADTDEIAFLDRVRVISAPHGLDRYFPITKLEIPLDQPESTKYTMGSTVTKTLTSINNSINQTILNKVNSYPAPSKILATAKANAVSIMTSGTSGYVTLQHDVDQQGNTYVESICISNNPTVATSTSMWKWSQAGLAFLTRPNTSTPWSSGTSSVAMTNDGSIVADLITSGVLRVGTEVAVEGPSLPGVQGTYMFRVYTDPSTNVPHVLLNGAELNVENAKNSITINPTTGIKIRNTSGQTAQDVLWIDTNGNIHFKGTLEGTNGTFSGTVSGATIEGGTLNLGNGNFTVDSSGNVSMKGSFNEIVSPKISTIRPDENNSTMYVSISSDGLKLYSGQQGVSSPSLVCGAESSTWTYPYIQLGIGSGSTSGAKLMKMSDGLWLGTNISSGSSPSGGTGLWVDFTTSKVYKCINGTLTELGGGGSTATAVFG